MATVLTFVVVRAHLAKLCFAVITSVAIVSDGGVGTVTGAPRRCCASWDAGVLARITIGACRTIKFAVLAFVPSSLTVATAAPRRASHNPQVLACVAICASCARVGSFTVGTTVPGVRTVTSAAHASSARRGSRVLADLAVCTGRAKAVVLQTSAFRGTIFNLQSRLMLKAAQFELGRRMSRRRCGQVYTIRSNRGASCHFQKCHRSAQAWCHRGGRSIM